MRPTLLCLALLSLVSSGWGQSLAQLRIAGVLNKATWAQVEVAALIEGEARQVDVHVFLGEGTTGGDLIQLVASRLESSGFHVHLGPLITTAPSHGSLTAATARTLFIENALIVSLGLNGLLSGSITCSESSPRAVKVTGGPLNDSYTRVSASVFNPASEQTVTVEFHVQIEAKMHPAKSSERLMNAAAAVDWASERPNTVSWKPVRPGDGCQFTGFSLSCLNTRVEVQFELQ